MRSIHACPLDSGVFSPIGPKDPAVIIIENYSISYKACGKRTCISITKIFIISLIYPLEGCKAIALGSSRLSLMIVEMRLPSKSDIVIEFVPVSVQYKWE